MTSVHKVKKPFNNLVSQVGFTIIEVMIATLAFAVILLVITQGVLRFTTAYYKGINSSTTQNTAANLMNSISQSIQFTGKTDTINIAATNMKPPTPGPGYLCIGKQQFVFQPGVRLVNSGDLGVNQSFNAGAVCSTTPASGAHEFLQPHMRLIYLYIWPNPVATNAWNVSVSVAYGDFDLLCDEGISAGTAGGCNPGDPTFASESALAADIQSAYKPYDPDDPTTQPPPKIDLRCRLRTGSQFCNVSNLSTVVETRIQSESE